MLECFPRNSRPHLDVLDSLFESIVPEAIVQPESDEFQRGLGTKRIFRGHVEVIHEVDQLLTANRHINTLHIINTKYTDQNANSHQNCNTRVVTPVVRFLKSDHQDTYQKIWKMSTEFMFYKNVFLLFSLS